MGFVLLAAAGCAAGYRPLPQSPSAESGPVLVVVRSADAVVAARSGPVPWLAPLPVIVPDGGRARLKIEAGTHVPRGRLQAYRLRLWEEAAQTVVADAVVWVAPGGTARVLVGPASRGLLLEVHRLAPLPVDLHPAGQAGCGSGASPSRAYGR